MGDKHSRGRAKTPLHPVMHQERSKGPEQILSTVLQTSREVEKGAELGEEIPVATHFHMHFSCLRRADSEFQ